MKDCCRDIEFTKRIVYCSKCGTKHNREHKNFSMFDYAKHKGKTLEKRFLNTKFAKPQYLVSETSNYNTIYKTITNMEYKSISGILDDEGASISFKKESYTVSISKDGNEIRKVEFTSIHKTKKNDKFGGSDHSFTFKDEDIFDLSDKEFETKVFNHYLPTWYKWSDKETFNLIKSKCLNIECSIKELNKDWYTVLK